MADPPAATCTRPTQGVQTISVAVPPLETYSLPPELTVTEFAVPSAAIHVLPGRLKRDSAGRYYALPTV